MKFIKADFKDVEVIHSIVHSTIKEVYPKYYPEGVVDFFLTHHSLDVKGKTNIEDSTFILELYNASGRSVKVRAFAIPSQSDTHKVVGSVFVSKSFVPKVMYVTIPYIDERYIRIGMYDL